ncbi:MAG: hypothetical protein K2Y12_03445 [Chitinophagaceae bacterium]|nr:hypothetical protein [Chitinophagaceae bacterium]
MFWKFLLLWFKFIGLIVFVNWISMQVFKALLYANSSLVNKSSKEKRKFSQRIQLIFQLINLIPYYFLLKMAVEDYDVVQLSRLQLVLLFIPFFAGSSFLRKASQLDKTTLTSEEIDEADEIMLRKFYSDTIIQVSLQNGLAIAFFIHLILIIAPSIQSYFL